MRLLCFSSVPFLLTYLSCSPSQVGSALPIDPTGVPKRASDFGLVTVHRPLCLSDSGSCTALDPSIFICLCRLFCQKTRNMLLCLIGINATLPLPLLLLLLLSSLLLLQKTCDYHDLSCIVIMLLYISFYDYHIMTTMGRCRPKKSGRHKVNQPGKHSAFSPWLVGRS